MAVTVAKMKRDLGRLVRDLEQLIRDVKHWNRINPAERPIDFEPERLMLAKARAAKRAIDAGDMAGHSRLVTELAELGRNVMQENRTWG